MRLPPLRDTIAPSERLTALMSAAGVHAGARDHETLDRQVYLAQIASPTGSERARAISVAAALAGAANAPPEIDDAGNVIAHFARGASHSEMAPVVCMAHLDTVFDHDTVLRARREGERVYCPGIGDNSRGLSAMVTLAHILHADATLGTTAQRPIEFVATVGEEGLGNLLGAHAYFANRAAANKPAPHAVLVLDGPGDENIVHHALGSRRYRITFRGAGGHSWVDFGAPNAVHAASRAAAWLAEVPRDMRSRVALTVSGIGGGESMNAIPANAWLDVDVRATDQTLLMRVDAQLRNIVQQAAAAENSASLGSAFPHHSARNVSPLHSGITLLGERPCGALPVEHALVRLAQSVTRHHGVDAVSAVASTDANVPLSLGIPAITIGAGGTGGGAHTVHEWYNNVDGARGVSRACVILAALAS